MVPKKLSTPREIDSHNEINDTLQVTGSLWLQRGQTPLGGHARIGLLEQIGLHGSITAAAKAAGMSYKAAWDAVDAMNNLAGAALVERSAGGRGGGGTTLTQRGKHLVAAFRAVENAQRQFLARVGADIEQFDEQWPLISRLGLQTSARNQLHGTITAIRAGGVNDEVTLTVPGGEAIVATLTHESTQNLELAVGNDAFALIKAPWVMIATDEHVAALPSPNRLHGSVDAVTLGDTDCEVILALPGGMRLAAVVPRDEAERQALAPGVAACAGFKPSSVILGVLA